MYRENLDREAELAEAIRKEARAKQQEHKAVTDRRRSELEDRLRAQMTKVRRFRHTQLLVRCGLAPWRQYMELVRYVSLFMCCTYIVPFGTAVYFAGKFAVFFH
jgi:hypothetical protein